MAWTINKLSDVKLRAAKPTDKLQKLSDGRGLQFWITPEGGRYWRYEYRFNGKRKLLALGTYPAVSAEMARERAAAARRQLASKVDPSAAKKAAALEAKAKAENTFKQVALRLIAKKRREGKAAVTIAKNEWLLKKVLPDLGPRSLADIGTPEVMKVLQREEEMGNAETARKMRTFLGEIFKHGMQKGIVTGDPVHATRGGTARPKAKHYPAILDPVKFGGMLRKIDEFAARRVVSGAALQLMALLYPRPGELRQATWDEFDLERAVWTIPGERMKGRVAHTKPLPRQAVEILKRLHAVTGPEGFVFPAIGKVGRPLSENTMSVGLEAVGVQSSEHVPHGFRASASTMLNDSGKFTADAVERELSHKDEDQVRRAYRRGEAMAERITMAQWWADHLDMLKGRDGSQSNIVPMVRSAERG